MSIEKKSLISTLKTAKKANVAKEDLSHAGSTSAGVKSPAKVAGIRSAARVAGMRNAARVAGVKVTGNKYTGGTRGPTKY